MLQTRPKLIIIQSKITLNFESVECVQVILLYIILHYIMLYVIMLQLHYSEEEMISR